MTARRVSLPALKAINRFCTHPIKWHSLFRYPCLPAEWCLFRPSTHWPISNLLLLWLLFFFFFGFVFFCFFLFFIIQTNKHTSTRKVYAVLNVLAPPNNTDNTCPQLLSFDPVVLSLASASVSNFTCNTTPIMCYQMSRAWWVGLLCLIRIAHEILISWA